MPRSSMAFSSIDVFTVMLPFRGEIKHALMRRSATESLFIRLTSDGGTWGIGEALPRSYLTGETVQSCRQAILEDWWPKLQDLRFSQDQSPHEVLASLFTNAANTRRLAAFAGLDLAVFDGWARHFGVPGSRLLGSEISAQSPISAVITMGMPPRIFTALYRLAGFRDFKIKVGDLDDHARVASVKQIAPKTASLRVDANAAWTLKEATEKLNLWKHLGISAAEEPLKSLGTEAWSELARATGVTLVADESLCTPSEAEAFGKALGPKVHWNLRLGKIGGFSGMLSHVAQAKKWGVPYQIGALVGETGVLGAAARACLSLGTPTYFESSVPELLLKYHPVKNYPQSWPAKATPLGNTPGLGVSIEPKILRQVTTQIDRRTRSA